jgi:hypothetical protein
MRVERRQPTRAEWAAITSTRPVVRKVLDRDQPRSRLENAQQKELQCPSPTRAALHLPGEGGC